MAEGGGSIHNSRLMHDSNPIPLNIPRILKRKSQHLLTRLLGNQLYTLHYAGDNNMFNPTVLALSVFPYDNGVDAIVGCFVSGNGAAGTDICEEREGATEG